ncbi:MAG: hypothetical protein KDA44_09350 [Planctomycetales bacterium]|nr:hypothetical protein [Planctomycetales bacterium]
MSDESDWLEVPRPTGVSILSILHLFGGVFFVAYLVFLGVEHDRVAATVNELGLPFFLIVVGVAFLAILSFASGIGMRRGTVWGWWCSTFFYVYAIGRALSAILTVALLADEVGLSDRDLVRDYVKYAGRAAISLLLLIYLFRYDVMYYFKADEVNKRAAVAIMIGVTIAIAAVVSGVAALTSSAS